MNDLEAIIATTLAEILECEVMPPITASFDSLGLDSLLGMRFAGKLADRFGMEVELEWLYDFPTIEQLASFLKTVVSDTRRHSVCPPSVESSS
jgi:acyl carrier protein